MSKIDLDKVLISFEMEDDTGEFFSDHSYPRGEENTSEDGKYSVTGIEKKGGEGQGEEYHIVLKIKDEESGHEEFWIHTGFYSSWEGVDWSYGECYQVEPVQKTITVYEEVKE